MKNRIPFGALTFAFTIAGACIGYLSHEESSMAFMVLIVATIGGLAASVSGAEK